MKQKSWKRIAIIAAIALAVAAGLIALAIWVIIPSANYGKANTLQDKGDIAEAFDAFDRMDGYRDSDTRKDKLREEVMASRTQSAMNFGGHDWLVMEERDGKALLLLKDVLEIRPYNEALVDTTWETCTLRAYLNGSFLNSFKEEDRARIAEVPVINSDNAEHGVKAGKDTKDRVFLLSLAEANLYFSDAASRTARHKGTAAWWWLRSPGLEPMLAATVGSDGVLGYAGSGVNYKNRGVRPAMWVKMG